MNRSEARDMAFKFLYQVEVQKENNENAIDLFIENNEIQDKEAKKYILSVARGVKENLENITTIIEKNLKQDWKIERISKVTLAILKLAIYEIIYAKIPFKVVINEAVELAKKYGEDTAPVFVNGILASVVKENV
ncbi:MAG: transcription antitermination factor NusB [Clostridia bacterium]